MDLGPHSAFIWLCYGITGVVIVGMIVWLWRDGLRLKGQLEAIELQNREPNGARDG